MIRRPLALASGRLSLSALILFAVVAATAAGPTSVARGQQADPAAAKPAAVDPAAVAFAAQLHAGDTTFLVVDDPLPHLKAFLTSPALRRAFAKGPLADIARAFGDPVDPVIGWDWALKNMRWIPRQVVVGVSEAGYEDLDHLVRASALFELTQAAASGNHNRHPQLVDELKTLRRAMLAEVQGIRLPRARLFVRFRDPADSLALLDLVRRQINDLDPKSFPDGLHIEPQERRLTVRFALTDLLGNDEQARAFASGLDLVDPDDGELTGQVVAALRQVRAEATLRVVDDGLLLTVGPEDAGGPAGLPARLVSPPVAVGPPDADTLFWGRWNARRLKQAAKGWIALHDQWAKSAAYALVVRRGDADAEPMLDSIRTAALQAVTLSEGGAARVWTDQPSGALRMILQEDRVALAPDLADHPVAKFLPADAEAYTIETTRGLGDYVSDGLLQFEDKLATRSLQTQWWPTDPNANRPPESAGGYYAHFGALRDLIHKAGRDRFDRGVLAVVGHHDGRVGRLEVGYEIDGRPARLSLRDLPTVELALVGKPKAPADEPAVRKYVEQLYAAFATGCRSAARNPQLADQPLPPAEATSKSIDLGLGVPTWGLDATWLRSASGEAKIRLDVQGDVRPHFFVVDGCVVLSTSARLSKSMLAAHDGKPLPSDPPPPPAVTAAAGGPATTPIAAAASRVTLPLSGSTNTLASVGRYPGTTLARMLDQADGWLSAIRHDLGTANGGDPDPVVANRRRQLDRSIEAMAQLVRLVDRVEWQTVQTNGRPNHVTKGAVFFTGEEK